MDLTYDESRRRFTEAPVAVLATVGPTNRPHTVPVVHVVIRDAAAAHVYTAIDDKPKRPDDTSELRRLRNIAANPQVSLLAQHYADDWTQLADNDGEIIVTFRRAAAP